MQSESPNGRGGTAINALTRIRLENWRNFVHVDTQLADRVFLIGPNASGKSNLLDAFRLLGDLVAVGGGFQQAVAKRGGASMLRSLAARKNPDLTVQVSVELGGLPWEYELTFTQDNQRHRPVIRREAVSAGSISLLDRPDEQDRSDPERLSQSYIEQVNANKPFRDLADFFGGIRYLHVVPQVVREPDRAGLRKDDPYGGDFLERIAKTHGRTQAARLRRIGKAMKVAVPQLTEVVMERDESGTPHLRVKYAHWRPQGAWLTEAQFSDGTLRLIGLLWALLDGSGPLLLEEPELSLHPEVVRLIPQLFARVQRRQRRQVIVSTHSPELLSDPGIGVDEVLVLRPGAEGTSVTAAVNLGQVTELVDAGLSMGEAMIPLTKPDGIDQLTLFG